MAFVAVRTTAEGNEILGVTRAISDPDNIDAEFAVLVRSDLKGMGLGRKLLEKLIAYTQSHGLQRLNGITMPNNKGMIGLAPESWDSQLIFSLKMELSVCLCNLHLNNYNLAGPQLLTTLTGSNGIIARLRRLHGTEDPSINREETHCDVVKI